MGILNAKAGSRKSILIVQCAVRELPGARRINKDPAPEMLDHQVARLLHAKRHGILQAGASPFLNGQAQPPVRAFVAHEVQKRPGGIIGHCDHVLFL